MAHLMCSAVIPAPRMDVYQFMVNPHKVPYMLEDSVEVEVTGVPEVLKSGVEAGFLMTRYSFSQPVRFRVEDVQVGSALTYRQVEGLFRKWTHTQLFEDHGDNQTRVTDIVDYELPFGLVGHLLNDLYLRGDLSRILDKRLKRTMKYFEEKVVRAQGSQVEEGL